ncbi:VirB3 family type IV secretion system protein [Caulobacter segnis]|uniref:VirB3 family type IV secretion system protein n=1 Tax=Caulobacter segnis TaxID=88688 RepID=UPI00240ED990|nr:VirB3 family type IV secretion system protein [Caulobacter segnis]MDG2522896.1 VirB3 family type IV secretion system protein [Caulobacter segnis]
MSGESTVPGYFAPVHQSLITPILIGGAPRNLALFNGTLAAAVGLGLRLWLAGLAIWLVGHALCALAAAYDPQFVGVVRRHLRHPVWLEV